jgi:hypothetical protein
MVVDWFLDGVIPPGLLGMITVNDRNTYQNQSVWPDGKGVFSWLIWLAGIKSHFFFSGDSDSKLLTHSWRGISVSMEDLLFLFFYLSYLSIFYPVDGPAKSCSTNLGWFFNPNKIMGCLPSTGDSDFAGPSTQDGPPQLCLLVYKPWNNPHEYYSYLGNININIHEYPCISIDGLLTPQF